MISMCLRCVVTLTVVAVFTLCKTTNAAARTSGVEDLQTYGPDKPINANSLRSQRRWPARLLKAAASAGFLNLSSLRAGKLFGRQDVPNKPSKDPQTVVDDLFEMPKFRKSKPEDFFKSKRFLSWQKQVKKKYGEDADKLMFETMFKKFRYNVNGEVDAFIAKAFNNPATVGTAQRFENLLLARLVNGMAAKGHDSERSFLRYVYYRGGQSNDVVLRMQKVLEKEDEKLWFSSLENQFLHESKTSSEQLGEYFEIINNSKPIDEVFFRLKSGTGFEHSAFLLDLLRKKAMEIKPEGNFAVYMVKLLQKAGWKDGSIRDSLKLLNTKKLPNDLNSKLVDPMLEAAPKPPPPPKAPK